MTAVPAITPCGAANRYTINPMAERYSLMIHGGAGELDRVRNGLKVRPYLNALRRILVRGKSILKEGGTALDTVETCVAMLEDDPLFNAGRGSVLNAAGKVEMDAAIMDGRNLGAGAVAAVSGIANPVKLARRVLACSEHVLLAGAGALAFASEQGIATVADDDLVTEFRRKQHEKACKAGHVTLVQDPPVPEHRHGTVGAVARDSEGNLAAATSTGGLVNKRRGRIGDSPIIGAGVYADNHSCAISATGYGEEIMRAVLAKHIASLVEFRNLDIYAAARDGITYFANRVQGRGGVIAIDRQGRCASGFTTKTMIHGWLELGGRIAVTIRRQAGNTSL